MGLNPRISPTPLTEASLEKRQNLIAAVDQEIVVVKNGRREPRRSLIAALSRKLSGIVERIK